MGFMTPTRDYRLPGAGWPGAPLRRFRDRLYVAHGLPPPTVTAAEKAAAAGNGPRVLLVPNKRDYGDALDPDGDCVSVRVRSRVRSFLHRGTACPYACYGHTCAQAHVCSELCAT